jgi:hypothetical protein
VTNIAIQNGPPNLLHKAAVLPKCTAGEFCGKHRITFSQTGAEKVGKRDAHVFGSRREDWKVGRQHFVWSNGVRMLKEARCKEDKPVDYRVPLQNGRVKSTAVFDVATDLIGRMQLLDATTLN